MIAIEILLTIYSYIYSRRDKLSLREAFNIRDQDVLDYINQYNVSMIDILEHAQCESRRRTKLSPYIDSLEHRIMNILRKDASIYWEVKYVADNRVEIYIDGPLNHVIYQMFATMFDNLNIKYDKEPRTICITPHDPKLFVRNMWAIDKLLPVYNMDNPTVNDIINGDKPQFTCDSKLPMA